MPFEIIPQGEYLLVSLKGNDLDSQKPNLSQAFKAIFDETQKKFAIIQCSECGEMSLGVMREIAQIYRLLKSVNGQVCLVGANTAIKDNIRHNGLDRVLKFKLSLRGALVEFGLAKEKDFDVNFINPFLLATVKVLKVQCFLEAKPGKPKLKKHDDPMLLGDISGVIGLTAEAFAGTLALSFPEVVFLKIASNMLGEECKAITPEIVDLAGELSNIILGQAKLQLNNLGFVIQQALPSCIWGKDHQVKTFGGGVCIILPFETSVGTFYTEISSNQGAVASGTKKVAA